MFIRAELTFDARTFRHALGRFPTGVCVLTSVVEGVPLGMTVSSFNSLSLNPPLVLFSIGGHAGSLRYWTKAEGYALNVLAESQREMSERFARPTSNKWEGTSYSSGLFGAPRIARHRRLVRMCRRKRPGGRRSFVIHWRSKALLLLRRSSPSRVPRRAVRQTSLLAIFEHRHAARL